MPDFAERRRMMVAPQVRPSDVTKYPIIEAMLAVPREQFVPDSQREAAYADQNVDLGGGRVLLEPRSLAKMLDAADLQNDELVLDVACGLGYSTAVAAQVAQMVIGGEADEDMAGDAQALLSETGADNAIVHTGPLAEGAAEHGPYDVILVQGGAEEIPAALLGQLLGIARGLHGAKAWLISAEIGGGGHLAQCMASLARLLLVIDAQNDQAANHGEPRHLLDAHGNLLNQMLVFITGSLPGDSGGNVAATGQEGARAEGRAGAGRAQAGIAAGRMPA
jgi:protein-L-isoaspartate(D-aspartate) O-methyltransferase